MIVHDLVILTIRSVSKLASPILIMFSVGGLDG
jgi:hypothetical protein